MVARNTLDNTLSSCQYAVIMIQMMTSPARTAEATALTELILETFRLNGCLLSVGDRLTGDLGLTSARWQILGAVDDRPRSVAQIARRMGLTRQGVQRIANVLVEEGFADFADNPEHKRAKLVRLTAKGRAALDRINQRQAAWSARLASGMRVATIHAALAVLRTCRRRLEAQEAA